MQTTKTKRDFSIPNDAFHPLRLLLKLSSDSLHFAFHKMLFRVKSLKSWISNSQEPNVSPCFLPKKAPVLHRIKDIKLDIRN